MMTTNEDKKPTQVKEDLGSQAGTTNSEFVQDWSEKSGSHQSLC